MTTSNFIDHDTWFARLPGVVVSAGGLITDPAGRILLVKPNYRDHWTLPGGICEYAEPPHVACAREVLEEIGLDLPIGPLLVIGWSAPDGDRPNPIMHFVFDGGTLAGPAGIVLQEEELDDYRFIDPAGVAAFLPPFIAPRISAALTARASGAAIYLPSTL
jgi:8-oxo-dGTP pyrophosphatase MutT (NUDIX family)